MASITLHVSAIEFDKKNDYILTVLFLDNDLSK